MQKKRKFYAVPRIPAKLTEEQFAKFVLKHIPSRRSGPRYKIPDYKIFNYILYFLHTGCQWKMLPIALDVNGNPEIHYTRLFRIFQKWNAHGSFLHMFENSVLALFENGQLDTSVIHGDGTTPLAKKGGDCMGFSGHKHMKGEKIVAFCDRHCNVLSPMVRAAGNRHESPLFPSALGFLKSIMKRIGSTVTDTIMSLDSAYDSKKNRTEGQQS